MAVPRSAIVVGIVVLAAGGAYLGLRGGNPTNSQPTGGAALPDPRGSGKAAIAAPEGPTLPTGSGQVTAVTIDAAPVAEVSDASPVDAPLAGSPEQVFPTQQRDPAWAGKTETELRRRIAKLDGAKLEAAECRHDQCLLTLGGSQEDMATALARLESPKGLIGFAESIYLTAPEERDGKLIVRAYAVFDRAPRPAPPPK